MLRCTQRQGMIILLAGLFTCFSLYGIPEVVDANECVSPPSFLMHSTLLQYGAQKDIYTEGEEEPAEGETTYESIFLPWEQYAALGGVMGLALGIVWLAEDPPSPCMVATAAYGTPLSPRINILRRFRDQVLLNTIWGTALVDVYYHAGWRMAAFIREHDRAAWVVRLLLVPILFMAAAVLAFPTTTLVLGYGLLATTMLLVLYWMKWSRGSRNLDVQAVKVQKKVQ